MRSFSVAILCLALCACRQTTEAKLDEPQTVKEKGSSGTITLDEQTQQKAHVVFATLKTRDIAQTLIAPGKLAVNEDRTWHVGAVVNGKVEELTARAGDFVRTGQVLGRIHSHDEHEARAAFQQASIELDRARVAEANSRRLRDRAQRLLDLKAGSRQDVEIAEAQLRNAQAAIDKAQSEVNKENAHLTDILHIPVNDQVGRSGSEEGVPIFSPASGVVLEKKATVGSVVNAGDEIVSLSDTHSLWMIAAANEVDLGKLHPGQTVRIEVRAYPDHTFSGRILKLGEQLDAVTRTLQIRILVPNPQDLLKPEMYATAAIDEKTRRTALFVPEEAIQDINGISAVFLRRSSSAFEPRTIKTGQHSNGEAEVIEGLSAGDTIVVKGSFLMKSQLLRKAIEE
jgi:cobalt-zinc-cadmium efflux system membrane fusion protein